jgi:hypothetical protein
MGADGGSSRCAILQPLLVNLPGPAPDLFDLIAFTLFAAVLIAPRRVLRTIFGSLGMRDVSDKRLHSLRAIAATIMLGLVARNVSSWLGLR